MNKVILVGRLTRDPEITYSQTAGGNLAISKYGIAVKKEGKTEESNFFEVTSFGKSAEFAEKYLRKGAKILLEGHLSSSNYTDRDGNSRYKVEIITEAVEFAESKADREARASQQPTPAPQPQAVAPAPAPAPQAAPQQAQPAPQQGGNITLTQEQLNALLAAQAQQAAAQAAQAAPAPAPTQEYPNDLGFC